MSKLFPTIETAEIEWRNHLPFSLVFNDVYFSSEDGLGETEHVFIQGNELIERWQQLGDNASSFIIAEIGFGIGLNFLCTWQRWLEHAPENTQLVYYSCEKFPLKPMDLERALSCWPQFSLQAQELLANYPSLTPGFHILSFANNRIRLILILGDARDSLNELLYCGDKHLEEKIRQNVVDAWYLDGFAPKKNEELWGDALFRLIALLSGKNTSLATYSVAANVKKGLQEAGFQIEKYPGFGKKREMLKAKFIEPMYSVKKRRTPWHIQSHPVTNNRHAVIVGAGMAGCLLAYALAKRGWCVDLLEAQDAIAQGGSGNEQAIIYPQLSAYHSPLSSFSLSAYLYALRFYRSLPFFSKIGCMDGILRVAYDQNELQFQEKLQIWLTNYPELGKYLTIEEMSTIAGIPMRFPGLFLPKSGWVNIPMLCALLLTSPNIRCHLGQALKVLERGSNTWLVNDFSTDVVILANSINLNQTEFTKNLPYNSIAGQINKALGSNESFKLQKPICGNGFILPAKNQAHAIGATYHIGKREVLDTRRDDDENLNRLTQFSALFNEKKNSGRWQGVRMTTSDYLPLVGGVPVEKTFYQTFQHLSADSNYWIPEIGGYYPGLYVCAGFGSRGLASGPLCAEYLAALINGEPDLLPQSMSRSLSPARFLIKDIVHR